MFVMLVKQEFFSVAQELANQGHQVFYLFPDEKGDSMKKENGIWFIRMKARHKTRLDYLHYRKKVKTMLEKLVLLNHLDLVECSLVGAATIFYQEIRTVPIVINAKDCFLKLLERRVSSLPDDIQFRLLDWEREFVHHGDCFLVENDEERKQLKDRYDTSSNIKLITNEAEKRIKIYRQVIKDYALKKSIDNHHEAS